MAFSSPHGATTWPATKVPRRTGGGTFRLRARRSAAGRATGRGGRTRSANSNNQLGTCSITEINAGGQVEAAAERRRGVRDADQLPAATATRGRPLGCRGTASPALVRADRWLVLAGPRRHRLFRYDDAYLAQHPMVPSTPDCPYADYYVVRLWEDLLDLLPAVLSPAPNLATTWVSYSSSWLGRATINQCYADGGVGRWGSGRSKGWLPPAAAASTAASTTDGRGAHGSPTTSRRSRRRTCRHRLTIPSSNGRAGRSGAAYRSRAVGRCGRRGSARLPARPSRGG